MRLLQLSLVLLLSSTTAFAKQVKDPGDLSLVPSPERLIQDVDEPTDLERHAKRHALLLEVRYMIHAISHRDTEPRSEKEKLIKAYNEAMGREYQAYIAEHPGDEKIFTDRSDAIWRDPAFDLQVKAILAKVAPGLWEENEREVGKRDQANAQGEANLERVKARDEAQRERNESIANSNVLFEHVVTLAWSLPLALFFLLRFIRAMRSEARGFTINSKQPLVIGWRGIPYEHDTYSGIVMAPETLEGQTLTFHGNYRGVYSTSEHYRTVRFFLMLRDGQHRPMESTNEGVHVATGQLFSGVELKGADGRWNLFYYNHHTGQETLVEHNIYEFIRVQRRGFWALALLCAFAPIALLSGISAFWFSTVGGGSGAAHPVLNSLAAIAVLLVTSFVLFSMFAKRTERSRRERLMHTCIEPARQAFREQKVNGVA